MNYRMSAAFKILIEFRLDNISIKSPFLIVNLRREVYELEVIRGKRGSKQYKTQDGARRNERLLNVTQHDSFVLLPSCCSSYFLCLSLFHIFCHTSHMQNEQYKRDFIRVNGLQALKDFCSLFSNRVLLKFI